MEQEIIKRWVLVDPDNPFQHIRNTMVGQPYTEGFIQPHAFIAECKNSQNTTDQCDEDHQPGRKLFKIDFFGHRLYESINS